VRYVKWLTALAQGDWGFSFGTRGPVIDLIWQRLPQTLIVVGTAYLIAVLIAIPIGVISAVIPLINRQTPNAKVKALKGPTFNTFDSDIWNIASWSK
jgi:ABC-type antimicrobial peptide transport system permease subunit